MISGNVFLQRRDAMETETNTPAVTTWQPESHTRAERAVDSTHITGMEMTLSAFKQSDSGQKHNA